MSEAEFPVAAALHAAGSVRMRGTGVVVLLRSVLRHRVLVAELARREITDAHAGQAGGAIWVIVHPIVMFIIYAVLFTLIFKVRIGNNGPADYLVYLFAGLAPWFLTQDVLSRATGIMFANSTIVKKVMFPPEALTAKSLLAAIKVQSVLLLTVVLYVIAEQREVPPILALLPVVYVVHVMMLWGLALLLSATAPYFRDVSEFVRIFLLANMYLVPIMYVPDMVPARLRFALSINPFSHLIWCYQDVIYFRTIAHPVSWGVLVVMAGGALLLGSYVFIRLRNHFASVV